MKFAIITTLLSATALASPLEARQPAEKAFFRRTITNIGGSGCPTAADLSVTFITDQIATVTFRRQTAQLPQVAGSDRERVCTFTLPVSTPAGPKRVNAVARVDGRFTTSANSGIEGFSWRHHVYDGASVTQETRYTTSQSFTNVDNVPVTTTLNNRQDVSYTFEGRVRLQDRGFPGASATLTHTTYTLDITNQS